MKYKIFSLLFLGVILPLLVFAAPTASVTLKNPLGCSNLGACVCKIAGGLFVIGVPISVLMIVYGAFQMLVSGGEPEKFSTARKTIMYAVAGFTVLLISRGIVTVVYVTLGGTGKVPGC